MQFVLQDTPNFTPGSIFKIRGAELRSLIVIRVSKKRRLVVGLMKNKDSDEIATVLQDTYDLQDGFLVDPEGRIPHWWLDLIVYQGENKPLAEQYRGVLVWDDLTLQSSEEVAKLLAINPHLLIEYYRRKKSAETSSLGLLGVLELFGIPLTPEQKTLIICAEELLQQPSASGCSEQIESVTTDLGSL
jgi:hypothetical protein